MLVPNTCTRAHVHTTHMCTGVHDTRVTVCAVIFPFSFFPPFFLFLPVFLVVAHSETHPDVNTAHLNNTGLQNVRYYHSQKILVNICRPLTPTRKSRCLKGHGKIDRL